MIKTPLVTETYQTLTDGATVAANRRGELTDAQRARLERSARTPAWLGLILLLVIGGAFLLPTLGAVGVFNTGHVNALGTVCSVPCALVAILCVSLAVITPFSTRRRNAVILAAIEQGTIAQAEGSVIFSRGGYRADANGQRLRLPRAMTIPLPPGRYRFYYLPQPPILLSAEPLQSPSVAASRAPAVDPLLGLPGYVPTPMPDGSYPYATVDPAFKGLLDALAEGNRFTMDELNLNRGGRMSRRQARRLASGLLFRVIFSLCFMGFGLVPFFLALTYHAKNRSGIYIAALFALGGVVLLLTSLRRIADMFSRRAEPIEGLVEPVRDSSGDSTTFYYKVGGKKLQVSARAYQALVPGIAYRVYYAPRSRKLLSIEPLGSSAESPRAPW
jgi:hypothetical protein